MKHVILPTRVLHNRASAPERWALAQPEAFIQFTLTRSKRSWGKHVPGVIKETQ